MEKIKEILEKLVIDINLESSENISEDTRWRVIDDCNEALQSLEQPKKKSVDEIRDKFFKECTDGAKLPKVNLSAHNVFEWFRNNLLSCKEEQAK